MSINIKVRYRVLMTHGLSYDIESQNTNLTLLICQPEPSLRSPQNLHQIRPPYSRARVLHLLDRRTSRTTTYGTNGYG